MSVSGINGGLFGGSRSNPQQKKACAPELIYPRGLPRYRESVGPPSTSPMEAHVLSSTGITNEALEYTVYGPSAYVLVTSIAPRAACRLPRSCFRRHCTFSRLRLVALRIQLPQRRDRGINEFIGPSINARYVQLSIYCTSMFPSISFDSPASFTGSTGESYRRCKPRGERFTGAWWWHTIRRVRVGVSSTASAGWK